MKYMNVYSLYDVKVEEIGGLVVMANDASVMRALAEGFDFVNGKSTVEKYPEDFRVLCLGIVHTSTGFLEGVNPVRVVCELSALVPRTEV